MMINRVLSLSLLAFPFVAQAHSQTGSASAVVAALTTISNQLTTLNNTLNDFNGGLIDTLTALEIQGESSSLVDDINKATSVIKSTPALNDTDSLAVASAVLTLQPNIYSVLDNLVARHDIFEGAILDFVSVTWLVEIDLKTQKKSTDQLGAAITNILSSAFQSIAPAIIADIDTHFTTAINAFDS